MSGAERLLGRLHDAGCATAVVSGGFMFAATRIKARLGLSHAFANTLEIDGGALTGRVVGQVVTPARKAQIFNELLAHYNVPKAASLAIGDGANDIQMLAQAGVGVAFHGKQALRKAADLVIDEGGLDALLPYLAMN